MLGRARERTTNWDFLAMTCSCFLSWSTVHCLHVVSQVGLLLLATLFCCSLIYTARTLLAEGGVCSLRPSMDIWRWLIFTAGWAVLPQTR